MNSLTVRDALQQRLDRVFLCTKIRQGVYLIEPEIQDEVLSILYYQEGATRETSLLGESKHHVHIDQDQWERKPVLLLNRLTSLYGKGIRIHARATVVARIDKNMAMEFQQEHHLQGALAGKYRYGLFEKGELVAVAVFSGLRTMRHTAGYRSIELLHFCQKGMYLVRGGLSKLLGAMIRDFHPDDVMTYIDRDWSEGDKFESLGFKRIDFLAPVFFRIDKQTYERIRISTEVEFPVSENHYIIQNLGSVKMIKVINPQNIE